jgi:5-methylcytosine-specific restriction endonuclease McrA
MSAEVDEVIPISRGGSPIDKNNVQLVHRICNQRKGNKIISNIKHQEIKAQPLPTSRDW